MNNYLRLLMSGLVPFIMLGIAVALLVGLIVVFSYILLWGMLIGVILWIGASIKEYFFPSKSNMTIRRGRIIEYTDDNKRKQ